MKLFFTALLIGFSVWLGLPSHASETPCFTYKIDATNPNELNNPLGVGFPGYRGVNQLIRYTAAFPKKSTETNEYGTEVVVKHGQIIRITGANTPLKRGEFVLSGHGKSSRWLLEHAHIGSRVQIKTLIVADLKGRSGGEGKVEELTLCDHPNADRLKVEALLDYAHQEKYVHEENYLYKEGGKMDEVAKRWKRQSVKDFPKGKVASPLASEALENELWGVAAPFEATQIQGVWHRPRVEESSEAAIEKILDRFIDMGINTVFLETFVHGYTLYESKVYPRYGLASSAYPALGKVDQEALLTRWLRLAHAKGIKVHAWVQVFYVGNTSLNKVASGLPPILAVHPDWANRQHAYAEDPHPHPSPIEAGHWFMDPAHPQVQNFIVDLMDELATTYPVDGIQLDYIRYPASLEEEAPGYLDSTWGYTPTARQAFIAQFRTDPLEMDPESCSGLFWEDWKQFKAQQVTNLVLRIRQHQEQQWQSKREAQHFPRLALSAAVFPDPLGASGIKHQDWSFWMHTAALDFISPMILSANDAPVCEALDQMEALTRGDIPVVPGLFSPFYQSPTFSQLKQLQASYQCGADGVIWFQSNFIGKDLEQRLHHRKLSLYEGLD